MTEAEGQANSESFNQEQIWNKVDKIRQNQTISTANYKFLVLGLIFLKYIWERFIEKYDTLESGKKENPDEYTQKKILFVPLAARRSELINQQLDINKTLDLVLKKTSSKVYNQQNLNSESWTELTTAVESIPKDELKRVYEYFLEKFALAEGRNSGQFDTLKEVERLFEVMLKLLDKSVFNKDILIYGQESNKTTYKLFQMHLKIYGVDFVIANLLFDENVTVAWMQHFIDYLPSTRSMGFVLFNSWLSSNKSGEEEIRKKIFSGNLVDCIVMLPTQLFSNRMSPACLWILSNEHRSREDEILFIDASKLLELKEGEWAFSEKGTKLVAETYQNWKEFKRSNYKDKKEFCKSITLAELQDHNFELKLNNIFPSTKKQGLKDNLRNNFLFNGICYELPEIPVVKVVVGTLLVPLIIGFAGAYLTNRFQDKARKNEIVDKYFARVQELITDKDNEAAKKKKTTANEDDEADKNEKTSLSSESKRILTRAATISTLYNVDPQQQENIFKFISEYKSFYITRCATEDSSSESHANQAQKISCAWDRKNNKPQRDQTPEDLLAKGELLNLSYFQFPKLKLSGLDLRGIYFKETNFVDAELVNAQLSGVYLGKANLTNASLGGAFLNGADLGSATLIGAKLNEAKLNKADLSKADYYIRTFAGETGLGYETSRTGTTYLHNADLSDADLSAANLSRADLSGANLTNANLYKTKNITIGQIRSARNWDKAIYVEKSRYEIKSNQIVFKNGTAQNNNKTIIDNIAKGKDDQLLSFDYRPTN